MIRTIGIGVMGCADIAQRMVIPAILASPYFQLKAVASRTAEKAADYAERFQTEALHGYETLLQRPDIEVVYMPLPTGIHYHWAMRALEAGKHLLIEKSLANNVSEVDSMVALAKSKGLLIMENFMFQHHSQMALILELLRSGQLGEIRSIRVSFGFPPFKEAENIRYSAALGGGALLDAGAYALKIVQLLPVGDLRYRASCLQISKSLGVDLAGDCFLTTDQGIGVHTSFGFNHHYQCKLEVWGSSGRLIAHRVFTAGPGVVPKIEIENGNETRVISTEADNHFLNLLNYFAGCLQSEQMVNVEYEKLLQQARLLEVTRNQAEIFYKP